MKIVFLDIETNGLDFDLHLPIEIGILIGDFDEKTCFDDFEAFTTCISYAEGELKHTSVTSFETNGINAKILSQAAPLEKVRQGVEDFLVLNDINENNAFFMCQNPSFDRIFFHKILPQSRMMELNMPYHWLDLASMYWMERVLNDDTPKFKRKVLSKDSIAEYLFAEKEKMPHRALQGAIHLAKCYMIMSGHMDHDEDFFIRTQIEG